MLTYASQGLVFVLGAFVCTFSVWGLCVPGKLCKLAIDAMEKNWGISLAVLGRMLFGAALIVAAPVSRFPHVFNVLGWIAIAAAAIILFMGRDRLRSFAAWFGRLSNTVIRVWLIFALAFGALLMYGIV